MAHEQLFHVGVKALITNAEGNILVLKTVPLHGAGPHWDIPGGRIQTGQTADETLRREVAEETGVREVRDISFFTAVISPMGIPVPDIGTVSLLLMIYKATVPDSAVVTLSEEHTSYDWVAPDEAAVRLRFKYPADFTRQLTDGKA